MTQNMANNQSKASKKGSKAVPIDEDALHLIAMEPEHLDRITEMEKYCFKDAWSRHSFEEELSNKLAFYHLFTDGNTIIGYCGIWMVVDEGHITNIGIDPAYQGHSYGEKMMRLVMDWAKKREICRLTLEVRVSNEIAIYLYEKLGFKSAGIRPEYYEDTGEDACIMWIEL